MKKRRINWPYGNPDFTAFEVESAAGVLVARRNHALVRTGERLCQGWDLWLDGKFAGSLSSRTLSDLATLSREELLRVTRLACCGRHHDFHPGQPSLAQPTQGRSPAERRAASKGRSQTDQAQLSLAGLTIELIDARRGERSRGEYLDSLVLTDPPISS